MTNPMDFINQGQELGRKEPTFIQASAIQKKTKVEYFEIPAKYQEWMEKNPYIEVINIINNNNWIVVTYKEA